MQKIEKTPLIADIKEFNLYAQKHLNALYQATIQGQETLLIGVDEVGLGSLAGPLLCTAVNIKSIINAQDRIMYNKVNDSKILSPKLRQELSSFLRTECQYAIASVTPGFIDQLNVFYANHYCMLKSIESLLTQILPIISENTQNIDDLKPIPNIIILIDGKYNPAALLYPQTAQNDANKQVIIALFNTTFSLLSTLIKHQKISFLPFVNGDAKFAPISAASIIAKVQRDQLMSDLDTDYGHKYLWSNNKGYGTQKHVAAIKKFGLCDLHRRTFCSNYM